MAARPTIAPAVRVRAYTVGNPMLDELGRGTSAREGSAFFVALLE